MKRTLLFFVPFLAASYLAIFLSSKGTSKPQVNTQVVVEKPLVLASIEPLRLLISDLYGDQIKVQTLLKPSQNPHQANLSTSQLVQLSDARLVVWLGEAAEPMLANSIKQHAKATLALLDVVEPQAVIGAAHDDEHAHGGIDPHLWTDPQLIKSLLPYLVEWGELLGIDNAQLAHTAQMLTEQLDKRMLASQQAFKQLSNQGWISYHNPWRYYERRMGLAEPLVLVEQPGGDVPSRQFVGLAQQIKETQVGCAIVEPEARLALINRLCKAPACQTATLDPLARDTRANSYVGWLEEVEQVFVGCLAPANH